MKKQILSLALILLSSTAISNPDSLTPKEFQILCITEFPTTSFIGYSINDQINMRFVNSNGIQFMPISSSLITIHDLKLLSQRAEVLKNLDSETEFQLQTKDCVVHADQTFFCDGGHAQFKDTLGNTVQVDYLASRLLQSKSQNNTYNQVQVTLGLRINKESYSIDMNYAPFECGIDYK